MSDAEAPEFTVALDRSWATGRRYRPPRRRRPVLKGSWRPESESRRSGHLRHVHLLAEHRDDCRWAGSWLPPLAGSECNKPGQGVEWPPDQPQQPTSREASIRETKPSHAARG